MIRRINKKIKINLNYFFLFFTILLFLDQVSKYLFNGKKYFENYLIYIYYSKNYGSAFSIFSNVDFYNYIVIIISLIVLVILFFNYKYFFKNKLLFFVFILGISGICGNLLDRLILGYVQDFIGFKYLFIFNFADIYLNLALLLYLFYEFFNKNEHKK